MDREKEAELGVGGETEGESEERKRRIMAADVNPHRKYQPQVAKFSQG